MRTRQKSSHPKLGPVRAKAALAARQSRDPTTKARLKPRRTTTFPAKGRQTVWAA